MENKKIREEVKEIEVLEKKIEKEENEIQNQQKELKEEIEDLIELVDLDEHVKHHAGKPAPRAKHYAFRVDKTRVVVDTPIIKGREILAKVNKTPETTKLYQIKKNHQSVPVGPDEIVNLQEPGLERFTTISKDATDGGGGGASPISCLKQDFRLPASDEEYLNGLGLPWETVRETATQWLIIHGWELPPGYNYEKVSLALLIPANYADSQIDMVYFKEHLARLNGRVINALSMMTIQGTPWQRWSRHRTTQNPWRIGIDDISTHLSLVDEWLRRELEKNP